MKQKIYGIKVDAAYLEERKLLQQLTTGIYHNFQKATFILHRHSDKNVSAG